MVDYKNWAGLQSTYLSCLRGWCGGFNFIIGDEVRSLTSVSLAAMGCLNWSAEPAAADGGGLSPVFKVKCFWKFYILEGFTF